ncbi:MAG: MtnX-like HAD-IB family phosphatase [Candidatus Magnetominusculus sp. LBB02]|nr:MtnX-like HAD-IB family phosphatase [Candidatus Magnetominusculus sp. LBB02]
MDCQTEAMRHFVAIDFDGTITDDDIVDSIIEEFAEPGWQTFENLWLNGTIGSAECLRGQVGLIGVTLETILSYVDGFTIDPHFRGFHSFLKSAGTSAAVVSDGFAVVIERMLANAGVDGISVYANELSEADGRLRISYPYSAQGCTSGNCKCMAMRNSGLPAILIGDGHSDFCAARQASMVLSKGKLSDYCRENGINFYGFNNFKDIEDLFVRLGLK